jgi:hypothetical protein
MLAHHFRLPKSVIGAARPVYPREWSLQCAPYMWSPTPKLLTTLTVSLEAGRTVSLRQPAARPPIT